jgi:hypothetical protein
VLHISNFLLYCTLHLNCTASSVVILNQLLLLIIQVDLDIKESKSETEEKSDEEEEEEESSEKVDNIKLFVFHSGKFSF